MHKLAAKNRGGKFRYCPKCAVLKLRNTENFRTYFDKNKGRQCWEGYCKPCDNKYSPVHRFYSKISSMRYPLKNKARQAVAYAVKTGKLIKPDICTHCKKYAKRIEGHHMDYSKPLEVIWLCSKCHTKIHGRTEKIIPV